METGSVKGQRQGATVDPALAALETGLSNAVDGFSRDAVASRSEIRNKAGDTAAEIKRTYTRETLLGLRHSPLVGTGIGLEGELWRDLSCDAEVDQLPDSAQNRYSDMAAGHEHAGIRKDDGWRPANHRHKAPGTALAGSPPNLGGPHAWSQGDGSVAASPDRAILPGNSGLHRAVGSGWRRPIDIRSENDEEIRRPGLSRGGRDEAERERKLSTSAGHDEAWRPAPPGLGRSGLQRTAPPGLGSAPGDPLERPWGAGRGRLPDGERRVSGKPRDPPVEMPRHETARDPQLPEGWNRPRDRSQVADWRAGRAREAMGREQNRGLQVPRPDRPEGRHDTPAWLTADDAEEFESLSKSADSKRLEFEAEHNKLRGEREASKAASGIMDEISLEEIEAMKQESLAGELATTVSVHSQKPSRPQSALGLDVAHPQRGSMPGQLEDSQHIQEEQLTSRFSRFFNQGQASGSTTSLSNLANQSPGPPPMQQANPALAGNFGQSLQDVGNLQALFTSRAPSATGSVHSDLSTNQRNLLAQLQAKGSGNFSSSAFQQPQQPQMAQGNLTKAQMDRYLMEKSLLSPRSDQSAPGGGIPRPGQQPSLASAASNNHLLSILQGQHRLRPQDSTASQLSASLEPTFANPNPTQQQQQNLLNALNMGDQQQQQGGTGFSPNLLEQLQRMRAANDQAQQQQHLHQQMQQSQQGQAQNASLLAAFSAHMPREAGPPKQLPDDIFSFNPNHQLNRLAPSNLQQQQQPQNLGVGKNERLLQSAPQSSSSIAHLLQAQQFNQQARALGPQNASGLSNGLYNLQQQQANANQLAQLRGLQGQGLPSFPQYSQVGQAGLMSQGTQALGGADPQHIARFLEQQRQAQQNHLLQAQLAQQSAQARMINTQRLYQLQLAQQASQRQQQQQAAQAAMIQQQQLQQQLAALPANRLSSEALLRQQQLLQQMGGNSQGGVGLTNDHDSNLLARLFANSGMNNLPGRGG